MKETTIYSNFFKQYWIPLVAIGVAVLLGIGIGVYFAFVRGGRAEETVSREKASETEKMTEVKTKDEDEAVEEEQPEYAERIVFERNHRIWIMNPDGTEQRQITKDGYGRSPVLSPDGEYVLFQRWENEPFTTEETPCLYIIGIDGSDLRRITYSESDNGCPDMQSFSPDGNAFAFTTYVPSYEPSDPIVSKLYVVNVDGTDLKNIAEDVSTPDWGVGQ